MQYAWIFVISLLLCLLMQAFFTMSEMAFVSYNRVRLQYYINQKDRKAIWLGRLLQKPTYLFGTTLVGVNFFLQLGSEVSRMLFVTLGLNPNYAMIMQVFLVLIFAELTPMFAARAYPEHTARLSITVIYFLSKILIPFIWILDGICKTVDWIFHIPPAPSNYLTRDELQKAIEVKDLKLKTAEGQELDTLSQSIFGLKAKSIKEIMVPLRGVEMISYESTVGEVKERLHKQYSPYILLYYTKPENIFGILYTRDLLSVKDDALVRELVRSPWFITEKTSLFQTIKHFRWNNQVLAVVLDQNGNAMGVITLDLIIQEIFQEKHMFASSEEKEELYILVDRSFLATTYVTKINNLLKINLPSNENETLEEMMERFLGHRPQKAEYVKIDTFQLTLEVTPFLTEKMVRITSI